MVFFLEDMSMNRPWWRWLSNTLSKDCGTTFETFHSRYECTWHKPTDQTDAQYIVNEVVHVITVPFQFYEPLWGSANLYGWWAEAGT